MLGRRIGALAAVLALASTGTAAAHGGGDHGAEGLSRVGHIVVVYEENHSFDNLYGGWEASTAWPAPTPRTRPRSTRRAPRSRACRRTT